MAKGMFGTLFGKQEHGGCCDMQIVEEPQGTSPDGVCDCDCGGACAPAGAGAENASGAAVSVKVLGPGCKKCHQLHDNALEAARIAGKPVDVEYVTDIAEIAAAGVMATPGLIIDGKLVSAGKVLSPAELKALL